MQYECEPIIEQLSFMNVYKAKSTLVRGHCSKEDILTLVLQFQKEGVAQNSLLINSKPL